MYILGKNQYKNGSKLLKICLKILYNDELNTVQKVCRVLNPISASFNLRNFAGEDIYSRKFTFSLKKCYLTENLIKCSFAKEGYIDPSRDISSVILQEDPPNVS